MQYTYDKRLAIGKEIVTGKITTSEAADKYSIGLSTAKLYAKQYRDRNNILSPANSHKPTTFKSADFDIEAYQEMSKEELINELIKKGYTVKGVGADKEFVSLSSKNSK